ncbi:hypothetical protein P153DRAFT_4197 [Dothidotthia symphoricarpi CBS 119687]|uniref:Uncharacterized protein n=1 Tax=Dothidotthia symphoricarpi CBS 119687 TaxID=1392245 RepID=A0A6A6ARV5_9PLEO|nr:uncharacterized protein P153DRAFT_4197 [Dothidotthia symphoricarpi CBS 119687]KAF2134540.1 hypothetical protein P153DRAFT_4197 [Dothidotthia symphoricarpi CBS 119687]
MQNAIHRNTTALHRTALQCYPTPIPPSLRTVRSPPEKNSAHRVGTGYFHIYNCLIPRSGPARFTVSSSTMLVRTHIRTHARTVQTQRALAGPKLHTYHPPTCPGSHWCVPGLNHKKLPPRIYTPRPSYQCVCVGVRCSAARCISVQSSAVAAHMV